MTKCEALGDAVNAAGAAEQVFPDGEGGVFRPGSRLTAAPCKQLFPRPEAAETWGRYAARLRFLV